MIMKYTINNMNRSDRRRPMVEVAWYARWMLFLLLLSASLSGRAQSGFNYHFAGRDTTIVRLPDDNEPIRIGEGDPKWCYDWSVDDDELVSEGPNGSYIVVNPSEPGDYIYWVGCVTDFGYFEDMVNVKVVDTVYIESVTPLRSCYAPLEDISTDDFKIITYPRGYEHMVTVSPQRANNKFGLATDSVTMEFTIHYNDLEDKKYCTLPVYNPDLQWYVQALTVSPKKFLDFVKRVEMIQRMMTPLRNLEELKVIAKGPAPIRPVWDWNFNVADIKDVRECCKGRENKGKLLNIGTVEVSAGIEGRIPITGIPHVTSIDAVVSIIAGIRGTLGSVAIFEQEDLECTHTTVPVTIFLTPSIAVQGYIFDPDVVSVTASVYGNASITRDLLDFLDSTIQLPVEAGLKFQVTVVNFFDPSVTIPLIQKTLTF